MQTCTHQSAESGSDQSTPPDPSPLFYKYDPMPNAFIKCNSYRFFWSNLTLAGVQKRHVSPSNQDGGKSGSAKNDTCLLPIKMAESDFPPAVPAKPDGVKSLCAAPKSIVATTLSLLRKRHLFFHRLIGRDSLSADCFGGKTHVAFCTSQRVRFDK